MKIVKITFYYWKISNEKYSRKFWVSLCLLIIVKLTLMLVI